MLSAHPPIYKLPKRISSTPAAFAIWYTYYILSTEKLLPIVRIFNTPSSSQGIPSLDVVGASVGAVVGHVVGAVVGAVVTTVGFTLSLGLLHPTSSIEVTLITAKSRLISFLLVFNEFHSLYFLFI